MLTLLMRKGVDQQGISTRAPRKKDMNTFPQYRASLFIFPFFLNLGKLVFAIANLKAKKITKLPTVRILIRAESTIFPSQGPRILLLD
jgi:hypothetical protein